MTDVAAAIQDAWTELRIHRGRVLMSLIGVCLAIAALTASVALGELARSSLVTTFESQSGRAATIGVYIGPGGTGEPGAAEHAATLDAIDGAVERYAIDYATARSNAQLPLGGRGGGIGVSVEAVDPDYATMRHLSTAEGRFLQDGDRMRLAPAVVVNRGLLESLGGGGLADHRTVELGGTTAVVVGVVDRGLADDWAQAWMLPRDVLRIADAVGPTAYLNPFQLEAWVPEEMAELGEQRLAQDLRAALPDSSIDANRSDWRSWPGSVDPLLPLQLTLVGTAAVILVLGALGLITVAVVSIRQRVRELGIRRAFGASRARIFVAVMLESVVGTVVAGAVGIALCIFAYRLPVVQELLTQGTGGAALPGFPMAAALVGLVVAAAVGAIAGSIPATIAVRSKVIEAIRF